MNVDPVAPSASTDDHVRLNELRALFDVFLPGAAEDEIAAVAAAQEELQVQQSRLESLLDRRIIEPTEYAGAVNSEITWCMRRSAAILGESRAKRLFGADDLHELIVIDPLQMAVAARPVGGDVDLATAAVLSRYVASSKEQRQVQKSVARINPQSWRRIARDVWGEREKYAELVTVIGAAEESYHLGAIEASIERAHAVIGIVSTLQEVGDAPLYLASWAHHIKGRGYEALADWRRAAFSYECSLAFKMRMEQWLPPLAALTTEIKLGSMEVFQSPIEAAFRLTRVAELLQLQTKLRKENPILYRNLLEDSRVALAEAHLAAHNPRAAIHHATSVLDVARDLNDHVGQVRIIFVLFRAAALDAETALRQVQDVISSAAEQFSTHPRVSSVLSQLRHAADAAAHERQSTLFEPAG